MPESHNRCSWSAWIGPERDSDREPDIIHVAPSDGAHVTESDVEWVRRALSAEETLTELQAWLKERITEHEHDLYMAQTYNKGGVEAFSNRLAETKTTLGWLETKRSRNV